MYFAVSFGVTYLSIDLNKIILYLFNFIAKITLKYFSNMIVFSEKFYDLKNIYFDHCENI